MKRESWVISCLAILIITVSAIGVTAQDQNGDVNCDSDLNILDIVYMIDHKFKGGPEPCELIYSPYWLVSDSVLFTSKYWGLARGGAGNLMLGDSSHTVVNLGINSTSGSIIGGDFGAYATISGGLINKAEAIHSTVSGGFNNTASGERSTIGGGWVNVADGASSTIGGGYFNYAGSGGTISGGSKNYTNNGFVGGGQDNQAAGSRSVIVGGQRDTTTGQYSIIGGGIDNFNDGDYSLIGGGQQNRIDGSYLGYSVIAGGYSNNISGDYSSILGGYSNTISSSADFSYLFGIESNLESDSTFMVDMPHIRFGDETTGYEFPTQDGDSGQILETDGNGALKFTDSRPMPGVAYRSYNQDPPFYYNAVGSWEKIDSIMIDIPASGELIVNAKIHVHPSTSGIVDIQMIISFPEAMGAISKWRVKGSEMPYFDIDLQEFGHIDSPSTVKAYIQFICFTSEVTIRNWSISALYYPVCYGVE